MKSSATINLPLHGGRAPAYLIRRMVKLSYAISKVIVDEYGQHEFLRRLADPLWFQAFGCVLGFDWHSSGVTTVVTGVLKQSLKDDVQAISIAGGKGRKSTKTKYDARSAGRPAAGPRPPAWRRGCRARRRASRRRPRWRSRGRSARASVGRPCRRGAGSSGRAGRRSAGRRCRSSSRAP